jgi:broad specificity phosphatase PhoE
MTKSFPATIRLHLLVPATTPAARRGVLGADDGLDQAGREAVRGRVRVRPWPETVVATCAPDRSCVETAKLLALHAVVDQQVRDWDLGRWTGRSLGDIAETSPQDLQRWSDEPDFAPHGGESLGQLCSRATRWLDLLETEGHPRRVTVAPVALVRAVLVSVLNAPTLTFWRLDLEPVTSVHISLRAGRRAVRWTAD